MPPERSPSTPLLTIAIPTYNRAEHLRNLLAVLLPQVAAFPQVEVLISDNASPDNTPAVVEKARAQFAAAGARLDARRHAENVGSDANFAFCFRQARGHFFWMCGDDDLIVPGGLAQAIPHLQDAAGRPTDVDLVYATSYGFHDDYVAERQGDPFGRRFHTLRNPRTFAKVTNIMFTFISGIIVNRERLLSLPHEDPEAFIGTNLVQLSWALPLLPGMRRGIVLWERPVAARLGNAHGYSVGKVFGERLAANVQRLLPGRRDLQALILNFALRRWFPSIFVEVRSAGNEHLQLDRAHGELKRVFGRNPWYWLFTWPAIALPLSLAKLYTRGSALMGKLMYLAQVPGFWRKQT
jgi:abequosyltransferase